jgi:hypothetical protein
VEKASWVKTREEIRMAEGVKSELGEREKGESML